MPVAAVGPGNAGWQALAGDLGDGARRQVEGDDVGSAELGQRADADARLDPPPVLAQQRGQGVGDRLRPARRDRPAAGVAGCRQRHPRRGAERPGQRAEGVGGDAAEQGPRARRLPAPGDQRRRRRGAEPEAGQQQRVPRRAQQRAHDLGVDRVEVVQRRLEKPPPGGAVGAEPRHRLLQRAVHRRGAAVVERVGEVDLRPAPLQPVRLEPERAEEGRGDGAGVEGRADVVQHARHGQLGAAGAAADRRLGLEHGHAAPRPAPAPPRRPARWGRSRPPSPCSRDPSPVTHRAVEVAMATPTAQVCLPLPVSPRATATGKSQDSSSQGWRSTMSATAIEPSSSSPSAAS